MALGVGFVKKIVLLALGIGLLGFGSDVFAAVIKDVRMWHAPERSRIVFDLDSRSAFKVFTLDNPGRVVIDLEDSKLRGRIPDAASTGQFVRQIRLGTPTAGTTRLVFDLDKPVRYFVRLLKPGNGYQWRLVVDFHHQSYDPNQKEEVVPAPPVNQPRDKNRDLLIVIDPGHGGEDPGAIGKRSREKVLVLQIAQRLKRLIDAEPGMSAVLTRNSDYYLKLRSRSAVARKLGADFFISIHADAFTKASARGASVYALSLKGATSESAKLLANKENLSDLVGGVNLADKEDVLAGVLLDLSMSNTINESLLFGNEVLSELKKIGAVHSKRVEQAGFAVLKSPDIPSILVETAYITNPHEEKLLRSKVHQIKIARAILNGVRRYVAKNPGLYARQ